VDFAARAQRHEPGGGDGAFDGPIEKGEVKRRVSGEHEHHMSLEKQTAGVTPNRAVPPPLVLHNVPHGACVALLDGDEDE
jgi:hypothetical protein